MAAEYTPPTLRPVRVVGAAAKIPVQANQRLGHQAIVFFQTLLAIPFTLRHYRKEVARLVADVGWGNGSLIVGGTADTLEYFYDPAYGNEHRLYRLDAQGHFVRDSESEPYNYHIGWVELERDPATGKYIDPRTGALIEQDPITGDYLDTAYYARRPLPWTYFDAGGGYEQQTQDGAIGYPEWGNTDYHLYQQWDNSTGYRVRTGTAGINLAAGRDLVLQERPSVIYTAGENAAPVDGFYAPANAWYSTNGGDLTIRVAGDIVASSNTPQMPAGWLTRRSGLDWVSGFFAPAADRDYDQTTWYVNFGSYEAGVGALGGGNVDIAAGGDVRNLGVSIPNTGRVTGNTGPDDRVTALHTTGGGNLSLRAGGNIAGGVYTVSDGLAQLTAGGAFVAGSRFEATGMTLNSGCGGSLGNGYVIMAYDNPWMPVYYDRIKLLQLIKPAQEFFFGGKFEAGHAILLARLSPK